MTYLELRDYLNSMTAEQLMQTVQTYSGDIDDAIEVISTTENSPAEMGESLPGYAESQIFLVLA